MPTDVVGKALSRNGKRLRLKRLPIHAIVNPSCIWTAHKWVRYYQLTAMTGAYAVFNVMHSDTVTNEPVSGC